MSSITGNPFDADVERTNIVGSSNNPFGDSNSENLPPLGETGSLPMPIPLPPPATGAVIRPSISKKMIKGYGNDAPQIPIQQGFELLVNIGFLPELVKVSLNNTGDVVKSFEILKQKVYEVCLRHPLSTAPSMWKAPIAVRIGT